MSRRTAFTGTAAGRRRERRANLQTSAASSAEVMHKPTPSRAVLTLKRSSNRVEKAVTPLDLTALLAYQEQIDNAAEKIERKNQRIRYSKPKTEFGVMAYGRQKMRGKSIALI